MSARFARLLIKKLDRKIRFERDRYVQNALKHYRDAIAETMRELGHDGF